MKQLDTLLHNVSPLRTEGDTTVAVSDVVCDSRAVSAGSLFIAVKGVAVDAHRFIPAVIEAGAAAIVCEDMPEALVPGVTYVQVSDSTVAMAYIAGEWYDQPSRKLKLVGVTGTNGKTTTATLLYELTRLMGYKCGLLSTVKNIVDTTEIPAKQTTPDHLTLNRLLHEMVEAGCEYAFMEVSSHSCVQHRIDGLTWAGGIFSNLTRDHLDFHKTVDNYIAAKKMFFDSLPREAFALVNIDDKVGTVMIQNCDATCRTYSLRSMAHFKCRVIEERLDGTSLNINGKDIEVLFTGHFNAYNLLAVYGTAVMLGFDPEDVAVKMSMLVPVAGRFQTIHAPQGYTAIVDYAHTPDALVNVLDTVKGVMHGKGNIITVCGCGGNRDAGKRPIMAREAARRSDKVILTSDNPRWEDPEAILSEMEAGLADEPHSHVVKISDRRSAIATACMMAQPGDVVVVAGKGHEDYQEIQGVKHHFDDCEELKKVMGIV